MNEDQFAAEAKKIQSVITKASQKASALSALADGGKISREKLQLTLEETAYFFESATLYLRALCETQMPGAGGYGRRDGLEFQLPSGHIEIAGVGWVHIWIPTASTSPKPLAICRSTRSRRTLCRTIISKSRKPALEQIRRKAAYPRKPSIISICS